MKCCRIVFVFNLRRELEVDNNTFGRPSVNPSSTQTAAAAAVVALYTITLLLHDNCAERLFRRLRRAAVTRRMCRTVHAQHPNRRAAEKTDDVPTDTGAIMRWVRGNLGVKSSIYIYIYNMCILFFCHY